MIYTLCRQFHQAVDWQLPHVESSHFGLLSFTDPGNTYANTVSLAMCRAEFESLPKSLMASVCRKYRWMIGDLRAISAYYE